MYPSAVNHETELKNQSIRIRAKASTLVISQSIKKLKTILLVQSADFFHELQSSNVLELLGNLSKQDYTTPNLTVHINCLTQIQQVSLLIKRMGFEHQFAPSTHKELDQIISMCTKMVTKLDKLA